MQAPPEGVCVPAGPLQPGTEEDKHSVAFLQLALTSGQGEGVKRPAAAVSAETSLLLRLLKASLVQRARQPGAEARGTSTG